MRRIRISSPIIIALSLLVLTGCTLGNHSNSGVSTSNKAATYEYTIEPTGITSTVDSDFICQITSNGDNVFMLVAYDAIEADGGYRHTKFRVDIYDRYLEHYDTIECTPNIEDNIVSAIQVTSDGSIWISESPYRIQSLDDVVRTLHYYNSEGVILNSFILSEKHGINNFELIGTNEQGDLYICFREGSQYSNYAVINKHGDIVTQWFNKISGYNQAVVLDNGRAIVRDFGNNTSSPVFFELLEDGEVETISGLKDCGNVVGSGENDSIYFADGKELLRVSLTTLELEYLANISDIVGIDQSIHSVVEFQSDVFYAYINGNIFYFDKASDPANTTTNLGSQEVDSREVIRAVAYGSGMAFDKAILDFNTSNKEFRIEFTDYMQYNTEENPEGGINAPNYEIIAGNIPDLFLWGMLANGTRFNSATYSDIGIFADIYELLDKDVEFSKDSFIPNIIRAIESSDGKLYELPFDFVTSVIACSSADIALDRWNFDEFYAELDRHKDSEFIYGTATRDTVLNITLSNNWDEYIDWQTGDCNFNTPSFYKLLEFCKNHLGEEKDLSSYTIVNEAIQDGRQYLVYNTISTVSSIQKFKAMFQGDVTFIGFPTDRGRGNAIRLINSASIYNNSPYKEACWEFVRQFCRKEYQLNNFDMFPTNIDAINERLTNPSNYEEIGNGVIYRGQNGEELNVTYSNATKQESDQIRELIFSLDRVQRNNSALMSIILEEAAAYFKSDKRADEVAQIIQSRVQIYLNE